MLYAGIGRQEKANAIWQQYFDFWGGLLEDDVEGLIKRRSLETA